MPRPRFAFPVGLLALVSAAEADATTLNVESSFASSNIEEYDYFGSSVADAGDIDGDGFDDVVVGAVVANAGNTLFVGAVYVYFGSASGPDPATEVTPRPAGLAGGAHFGVSVDAAGDVNADGFADVITGASYDVESRPGMAYVYLGGPGGLDLTTELQLGNGIDRDDFGEVVRGVGDVDGDGYDDVAVGAKGENSLLGAAYLYFGSPTGIDPTTAVRLASIEVGNDQMGSDITGGDFDGDGYADVAIGAPWGGAGSVYIYSGSATGVDATNPTILMTAAASTTAFGLHLVALDANNDGTSDLAVTANYVGPDSLPAISVFLGSPTGIDAASEQVFAPALNNTYAFGDALGAGDLDADGFDDLIVGNSSSDAAMYAGGAVHTFNGSASGIDAATEVVITSTTAHSYGGFGSAVDFGDLNGDGELDALVGAQLSDTAAENGGMLHVLLSCSTAWYPDVDLDGFGDGAQSAVFDCIQPAAWIDNGDDCDDTDGLVFPGADEVCDAIDNDCDGLSDDEDDDVLDPSTFYEDADDDGFGDSLFPVTACSAPSGTSAQPDDCDDEEASTHPGAEEICDLVDNDCDGTVDLPTCDDASPSGQRGPKPEDAGCGCSMASGQGGPWGLVLLMAVGLRRRGARREADVVGSE